MYYLVAHVSTKCVDLLIIIIEKSDDPVLRYVVSSLIFTENINTYLQCNYELKNGFLHPHFFQ